MLNRAARIVVAALLFGAVACSSGRPSKEDFIAAADEICSGANEDTTDLGEPTDAEQFADLVDQAKEIQDAALAELRDLQPPEGDEEEIDAMLDALERANSFLPEFKRAAAKDDFDAMAEVGTKIRDQAMEAEEIATSYGFEKCAASRIAGEG